MTAGIRPELKALALWRLACAYAVATNGTILMPLIVAALMRRLGVGEDVATGIAGLEIVGIAVTCAVLPRRVARSPRAYAWLGSLGTVVAQAAGAGWPDAVAMGASRAVAGVFEGMLFVVVAASLSQRGAAERAWGWIILVAGIFDGSLLLVAANLPGSWTDRWLFVLLAASFACVAVPAARSSGYAPDVVATSSRHGTAARWGTLLPIWITLVLAYGVLAAQWAVAEVVGSRIGLPTSAIGLLLSLASVLGLAGCLAASHRRSHAHRMSIVSAALLTMAAAVVWFFATREAAGFFVSQTLVTLAFYALTPFMTARLSELDPDGALVARSVVVCFASVALGTALAGSLLTGLGPLGLGLALGAAAVVALPFAWRVFARPAAGTAIANAAAPAAESS